MKVLVTGSSGLIGSALVERLAGAGHEVTRLVRRAPRPGEAEARWDPEAGSIDAARLEGLAAAVHLAGATIARRWTRRHKARILDSRVRGTRLLSETLAGLDPPPHTLVSASAIGIYGDRGDEALAEQSPPGHGFLPEVCRAWEGATEPAARAGIRVAHLRMGLVLSRRGGALARMLLPFRLGLGGVVGSGRQFWSWVALDDALAAVEHLLADPSLEGPVNVASPNPVTNREFTTALGCVLRRPTFFPLPAFAARLAFGQMADELLLASTRVTPARLLAAGFAFHHPELQAALSVALA